MTQRRAGVLVTGDSRRVMSVERESVYLVTGWRVERNVSLLIVSVVCYACYLLGDNAQAKSLTWTPGQIVSYRVSCSPSYKLSSSAQEGAGCRISAQHQPTTFHL